MEQFINKKIYYRPPFNTILQSSKVIATQELANRKGDKVMLLELENGETIGADSCYFEPTA